MKHFVLKGQVREVGNKAVIKEYRKQGLVPCNIYGSGVENILFTVTEKISKVLPTLLHLTSLTSSSATVRNTMQLSTSFSITR